MSSVSLSATRFTSQAANTSVLWQSSSAYISTSVSRGHRSLTQCKMRAKSEHDIIFPSIMEDIPSTVAGFSTRHFGNLSMSQEGAPLCENFWRLEKRVGGEGYSWALPNMEHGTNVAVVHSGGRVPNCDGLVTSAERLFICVTAADCGSVLLADPLTGVIGVCHCGWRGTAAGIVAATVQTMRREGAHVQSMRAFVGPCISVDSFEVGEEVAAMFDPEFVVRKSSWRRPHVDLKAAIQQQLAEEGVGAVEVHPSCTLLDSAHLFSHRGSQGSPERHMAFIALR